MAEGGVPDAATEEAVDRQYPRGVAGIGHEAPVSVAFAGVECDNTEYGHTQTTGW